MNSREIAVTMTEMLRNEKEIFLELLEEDDYEGIEEQIFLDLTEI